MSSSQDGSSCDRRLSRTARSLLKEKLLTSPLAPKDASSSLDLWQLLDHVLVVRPTSHGAATPADESSVTCPLLPQWDVGRDHELHSAVIPADVSGIPRQQKTGFTTARFARSYVNSDDPHWYKCLYCQKIFSSRYYLDLHQATQHHHPDSSNNNNTDTMICPATDWCPFLSPTACQHRALREEPYYDRGSAGRRGDRYKVQAKLWKQAHDNVPCTVTAVQRARRACRDVGAACFDHDNNHAMRDYWQQHVCGAAALSCPNQLQQLYFRTLQDGDLVLRQVHEWRDEWVYWSHDHHALGWTGGLILAVLGVYYAVMGMRTWQCHQHSHRAGPRLLRPATAKVKRQ